MKTFQNCIQIVQDSPLFDAETYSKTYPDVALTGLAPAEHYLTLGARLGRTPGPDFDGPAYLATYLDVAARGENPLVHYELHGRGEGRQPKPEKTPNSTETGTAHVDVVVPVYNALEDVQACLQSLAQAPNAVTLRALVINDGSDEDTTNWLRQACHELTNEAARFQLIEHPENRGYTKAVNTGLKASDAAYVVTLNSDTIVTPFWLDGMIRCMQSDPTIGITGPLSNAASWQNVPDLLGPDGKFAINALPDGVSPAQMADIIHNASRRKYPRSTFVNGFCFMVKRSVLDAVGYMDEGAFPMGYGEENDFCIRAQDAGFTLAYADDTYVFHAKSKSFGTERRVKLSKAGGQALKDKHGADKFAALVKTVENTRAMDDVRRAIKQALALRTRSTQALAVSTVQTQRILFILPVRGGGGGAHSVIQEVTAMRDIGVTARIAIREKDLADFLQKYGDIPNVKELFVPFTDTTLCYVAQDFDVAVATIFTSVKLVNQIISKLPWILPAYYAQDYEPMFFEPKTSRWQEAFDSYTALPAGSVLFAKTHWIGSTIEKAHDVTVAKVAPSIDHEVYNLKGAPRTPTQDINICAMIRPRTPRRGAKRTMVLLAKLKKALGDKCQIHIFGSDGTTPEFMALPQEFEFKNHGILTRPQVADLLRASDVFVDLSDYQAFGRTGLEAMACGAVAVVPKEGGSYEYAVDGVNALIVDTLDVDTCFDRLMHYIERPEKIATMQFAALETASRYCPRRAALSELMVLAPALVQWRKRFPKPTRPRVLLLPDQTAKSPGQFPGFGNERLPTPYFQEALLPAWEPKSHTGKSMPEAGTAEIAIVERAPESQSASDIETWCKSWRAGGGRLVFDLGSKDISVLTDADNILLQNADKITVSSKRAEAQLPRPLSRKSRIIPSYIDRGIWAMRDHPNTAEKLRIGYLGTENNQGDLERLKDELDIVQTHLDLQIEVVGVFQDTEATVGRRLGYFKRRTAADLQYSEFVSWLQEAVQWDIMILPDQSGDPLQKFLQATAMRAAVVCSDTADLAKIARNDKNCLIVGKKQKTSWSDAVIRLATETELRERLVKEAQQDLRKSWTVQNNAALYKSLLKKVW